MGLLSTGPAAMLPHAKVLLDFLQRWLSSPWPQRLWPLLQLHPHRAHLHVETLVACWNVSGKLWTTLYVKPCLIFHNIYKNICSQDSRWCWTWRALRRSTSMIFKSMKGFLNVALVASQLGRLRSSRLSHAPDVEGPPSFLARWNLNPRLGWSSLPLIGLRRCMRWLAKGLMRHGNWSTKMGSRLG